MPELPEVEITRRGVEPWFVDRIVSNVIVRNAGLRHPVPDDLSDRLCGARLLAVRRRGKYLLFDFDRGTLLVHLGMSGSLRRIDARAPVLRHDHVDLVFGELALRYHDPRRFGLVLWAGSTPERHPLIAGMGIEPLEAQFHGTWLHGTTRARRSAIKLVLMNTSLLVGVGNIYASESLFRAGIRPTTRASTLTRPDCTRLVAAVRATLTLAIAAGGSTLRDYVQADGAAGAFQRECFVYGRAGEPCRVCANPVRQIRQGQRSSFYCAYCQR